MTPILEYSDREHRYFADGREVLSVTQILGRAGFISKYAMDEEARWRGSEVHAICAEDDIKTVDLRKVDGRLRGYVRAWRQYRADSGFCPELIEERVDDLVNGYAGRLDRMGAGAIIDLKTSKTGSVADHVKYQLAAYAHALRPNHIFERIAVGLRPDGQYRCKVFPIDDFQIDLAQWLRIVNSVKNGEI